MSVKNTSSTVLTYTEKKSDGTSTSSEDTNTEFNEDNKIIRSQTINNIRIEDDKSASSHGSNPNIDCLNGVSKIVLPQRGFTTNEHFCDKSEKPSATVKPFNHVYFKNSNGETFYVTKFIKRPLGNETSETNNEHKRVRTAFTDAHLNKLLEEFSKNRYLNAERRKQIAQSLNLTEKTVKVWFQNRRMLEKRHNMANSLQESIPSHIDDVNGVQPKTLNCQLVNTIPNHLCQPNGPLLQVNGEIPCEPNDLIHSQEMLRNKSNNGKHIDNIVNMAGHCNKDKPEKDHMNKSCKEENAFDSKSNSVRHY